jgi:GrpB-like predicted nucleotidyltransferase (UPF0157 family)
MRVSLYLSLYQNWPISRIAGIISQTRIITPTGSLLSWNGLEKLERAWKRQLRALGWCQLKSAREFEDAMRKRKSLAQDYLLCECLIHHEDLVEVEYAFRSKAFTNV